MMLMAPRRSAANLCEKPDMLRIFPAPSDRRGYAPRGKQLFNWAAHAVGSSRSAKAVRRPPHSEPSFPRERKAIRRNSGVRQAEFSLRTGCASAVPRSFRVASSPPQPKHALPGLDPGIHVLEAGRPSLRGRRGWPGQARPRGSGCMGSFCCCRICETGPPGIRSGHPRARTGVEEGIGSPARARGPAPKGARPSRQPPCPQAEREGLASAEG